jgi:cytochrome c
MDSFEFNKIAGAVLGTALAVFGLKELSSAIYHTSIPEKPGFMIEVADAAQATPDGAATPGAPAAPIGKLLASADATKGAALAKACAACHNFEKGGPNKTGPNLWDVVDRPIASHEGFAYSEGIKAHSADKWTYDNLNAFIAGPKTYIKGTKMGYAGMQKDDARANVIAYLASLSDSPKPFPAP